MTELLDALWMLDLMIAHRQISYDGTLPDDDLGLIGKSADNFCELTGWKRDSVVGLKPPSEESQLSMQVESANDLFTILGEPVPGIDVSVSTEAADRFFTALQAHAQPSDEKLEDSQSWQEKLMLLGEKRFRGSKCVAGIAGSGNENIQQAFKFQARHSDDPGLAVSMLINRFRFGYLRRLAWEGGDAYVPGAVWRT